jgi:hypothetical protein
MVDLAPFGSNYMESGVRHRLLTVFDVAERRLGRLSRLKMGSRIRVC